jgi:hypothetical protein
MIARADDRMSGRPWAVPLSLVGIGAIVLVADGDWAPAWSGFAVLAGVAALPALGGRAEVVRLARGDGADEREALIDQRAMAFAGGVL